MVDRVIFFNGGWMSFYDGIGGDEIVHGGTYIIEHGFGGEVYNFRNCHGKNYGYVMTKSGTLNLCRIDAGVEANDSILEDVTCVFVARHPLGGRRIVGWYRNAAVYSHYQDYHGNDREIMTNQEDWDSDYNQVGYFAVARHEDVVLLAEDERLAAPPVPNGKDGFGQSNVWYADTPPGIEFKRIILKFISEYEKKEAAEDVAERIREAQSQDDAAMKKAVEKAAITRAIEYFENLGYASKSVEAENLGWDLEFTKEKIKLLVEVKGLSQSRISVMLSRNEYEKMREHADCYRLAVVTNCLDRQRTPTINVFAYIQEKSGWFDKYGHALNIEEVVMARCEIAGQ